jgi:hypothetical protein
MSTIVKLPPLSSVTPSDATLDGWVVTEGSPNDDNLGSALRRIDKLLVV